MDCRNAGDAQVVQGAEDPLAGTGSFRSHGGIFDGFDCGNIRARDEPALGTAKHDHAHLAPTCQIPHLGQQLTESCEDRLAEHVHFSLGVVEGDPGDAFFVDVKRGSRLGWVLSAHDLKLFKNPGDRSGPRGSF